MSCNLKQGAVDQAQDFQVDEATLPAVCAGAVFSMTQADETPAIASSACPASNMCQHMLSSIMPKMA